MAARTRTLAALEADARHRASVDSADDAHPAATIRHDINQAATELRDLFIDARGRSYFRQTTTITTDGEETAYVLPAGFLDLLGVRVKGDQGYTLDAYTFDDEPALRASAAASSAIGRLSYALQPLTIEFLPLPKAGTLIQLDYIPAHTDLEDDEDVLEGYNGYEEYVVNYAARQIALREDDFQLARELAADNKAIAERIKRLAPKRDRYRAEQVKNVRRPLGGCGPFPFAYPRRRGF